MKYYHKAVSIIDGNANKIKYQLDIVVALLIQDNYDEALKTLEVIINNDDIGFNEKNQAEELMAFTKQKMGI